MTTKKTASVTAKPKTSTSKTTAAIKDAYTKSQLLSHISEKTELTKKQVNLVFDELTAVAQRHLSKRGAGEFTIPGLAKCVIKRKPATKARKGTNPFTGEEMMFKAKPARNIVKIRPLKKLKEAAEQS